MELLTENRTYLNLVIEKAEGRGVEKFCCATVHNDDRVTYETSKRKRDQARPDTRGHPIGRTVRLPKQAIGQFESCDKELLTGRSKLVFFRERHKT